jgi:hypothetical protein
MVWSRLGWGKLRVHPAHVGWGKAESGDRSCSGSDTVLIDGLRDDGHGELASIAVGFLKEADCGGHRGTMNVVG